MNVAWLLLLLPDTKRKAIEALDQRGEMSKADLADLLGLSISGAGQILDEMVKIGMVISRTDEIRGPGRRRLIYSLNGKLYG